MIQYKISPSLASHLDHALTEMATNKMEPTYPVLLLRDRLRQGEIHSLSLQDAEYVATAIQLALDSLADGDWPPADAPDREARARLRASATFSLRAAKQRLFRQAVDLSDGLTMSQHCSSWTCPACDNKIEVLVPVLAPPTCSRHTGGGRQMVSKEGRK